MEFLDTTNDIRSNIIGLLLRLFKKISLENKEFHISMENYHLHYTSQKGLWIEGCPDRIEVNGTQFKDVYLGERITSSYQLPLHWMKEIAGE